MGVAGKRELEIQDIWSLHDFVGVSSIKARIGRQPAQHLMDQKFLAIPLSAGYTGLSIPKVEYYY
jgi:hypothetical protein